MTSYSDAIEVGAASGSGVRERGGSRLGAVALACTLFVLSGACGLAYEVIWARYLGLFLGNTVLVHTAVLGTFMGGLALGSLLIGQRADRCWQPLKWYGWLELGVAAYAFAYPHLSAAGQQALWSAAGVFPPGSAALLAVRVALAVALILPPTLLMGATFPLLTAHVHRCAHLGATGANRLYSANCAGAVLGSLITGFYLIPSLGLSSAVMAVAILNGAVGGLALLSGNADAIEPAPVEATSAPGAAASAAERTLLAAICLSGATAFLYELVWTRIFAIALGSSTYSFTLMLAAFITGLAAGSLAAGARLVRRHPAACLAGAELLIGVTVAASLTLYPRLPFWFWQWKWLLRPAEESMWLFHCFQYGLVFLVMAAPTFLFGVTFPAAIRAAAGGDDADGAGAHAARIYGWNTLGTLMGVVAAGAVLIPWLGLQGTLKVGVAANLGIALLVACRAGIPQPVRRAAPYLAGVCLVGTILLPRWPVGSLTYGAFRGKVPPPPSWSAYENGLKAREPVFYQEAFGSTVAVVRSLEPELKVPQLSLVVDGKTDATSVGDLPTQALIGQLPLLLKPDAKDVFILGLGSGVTAGSALTHPVERVDCVELSSGVVEASRYFREVNGDPTGDPRFHLLHDDGKTVLASTRRKYDVVISEPTNPWISGVGSLFSGEAFRASARALKPGGIAAQWFQTYSLDDPLVATIIRTFRGSFPHTIIFQGCRSDYVIIGSQQPIRPDFRALEERLKRPAVAADLARFHIRTAAALLSRQSHTPEAAAALAENGGVNTDDLPLLEYLAPRALYCGAEAQRIVDTDCRLVSRSGLLIGDYWARREPTQDELASLIELQADPRLQSLPILTRLLQESLRRWPGNPVYLRASARLAAAAGRLEPAADYARRASELGDTESGRLAQDLGRRLAGERQSAFSATGPASLVHGR